MRLVATLHRMPRPLAFWALAGLVLLVSHDAVYLAQMGPGESLARALRELGHGYWAAASAGLAGFGIVAGLGLVLRIVGLRRRAASLGVSPALRSSLPFASRMLGIWLRLFVIVAVGFAIQENLEHLIGHGHALGLGALLGPEYPLALPVIALITGAAAMLAAVLTGAEHALLTVIAGALRRRLQRPLRRIVRPPLDPDMRPISPLARASAGRAPPHGFVPTA